MVIVQYQVHLRIQPWKIIFQKSVWTVAAQDNLFVVGKGKIIYLPALVSSWTKVLCESETSSCLDFAFTWAPNRPIASHASQTQDISTSGGERYAGQRWVELLPGSMYAMVVRTQAKLVPQWLLGHKWPTAQETGEAKDCKVMQTPRLVSFGRGCCSIMKLVHHPCQSTLLILQEESYSLVFNPIRQL